LKSVLITGVCGGIGQALAATLAGQGWTVYGTDIGGCPAGLQLAGFWQGSIAEEAFWRDVIAPGVQAEKGLDGFVHNAAVQPCTPLAETTLAEWNDTLAVNLTAAFLGTRYLAPLMAGRGAAIVHVASVHALATSPGMAAYVASKGGLLAFSRAAALELAEQGIRVNAVLPGAVDTAMLEKGLQRGAAGAAAARQQLVSKTPLQRLGSPEDIARAVAFLLDADQSSFITGQHLVADGGVLARLASE
jgi:NAD(P)-dependent dehydrogenase (short-subunit alcohol dehydrogenase family)